MTWAPFAAMAAVALAIVGLALVAIRAHGRILAAEKNAAKSDAERIEAARGRMRAEIELDAAKARIETLDAARLAADGVAKELYAELRKIGHPGAAARYDGIMRRMHAHQARRGREASPDPGASGSAKLPDRDS